LVSRVDGGIVFLGVTPPGDITNVDERLQETVKRFGPSLADALRVQDSDIDKNIDYAIVADDGTVKNAAGGIPLKAVLTPPVVQNEITEIRSYKGSTFGALSVPTHGASGQSVGNVLVFDEVPPDPWYVLRNWLMNISSSGLLALFGTLISIPYLGDEFRPEKFLLAALQSGESATVEFKAALRWDQWPDVEEPRGGTVGTKKKLPEAEGIAVKNVAAFLNSGAGGTLLIGIADDKHVVGLDGDYKSLGKNESHDKNRDRFQVHLGNLLSQKIGRDLTSLCVRYTIIDHVDKDVCVIYVGPSPRPVYISEGDVKTFYVRQGASTAALDVEKAVAYIERRWPKTLWRKVINTIRMVRS
jgi:Putative DNA-binding domain